MFGIGDKSYVTLFHRLSEILEVVGNVSFSTPPRMDSSSSSFFMIFLYMCIDQEGRGSCGSCGKPGVFGGFSKRVLESWSLRSDFKGAVGDLW